MNSNELLTETGMRRFEWAGFMSRWGTVIALVALVMLFSLSSPDVFPTALNIIQIFRQISILGIIAVGLTAAMVVGLFDLSVGALATFGGYFVARLLAEIGIGSAWVVVLAIVAVLIAAALIGLVNGVLVAYLRVSSIVETLAMSFVVTGIVLGVSQGVTVTASAIPESFQIIGQGSTLEIPNPVLIFALVAVVLWVFLEHTQFGRNMYATGGNREAARLCGILFPRYALLGAGISAVCAALGGLLVSANLGAGAPSGGGVYLLNAFVTCFIGASTLKPGKFHVLGTVVGVLLIGVIDNGLGILGVASFWQDIAEGIILILALVVASSKSTIRVI